MSSFAKMLLFAVVVLAAVGIIGMETAQARCHGYSSWYSAPTCYTGGYYTRRACYRYVPNCGGYGYGGYGYGGYGYGGYGYGSYGYGSYGCGGYGGGYGGW